MPSPSNSWKENVSGSLQFLVYSSQGTGHRSQFTVYSLQFTKLQIFFLNILPSIPILHVG